MMKTTCGFCKWAISIDPENHFAIMIDFHNHPIYATIHLHDVNKKELQQLADMFAKAALEKP